MTIPGHVVSRDGESDLPHFGLAGRLMTAVLTLAAPALGSGTTRDP
jgi:hypothetical protein